LILLVSGDDEAQGGKDEAYLDSRKAEAEGDRMH
jgi:hypothetical protein